MKVAILVPRRAGKADRDEIWAFARRWWENDHPTWALVEGDHEDGGPFNRAAALNRAAELAGDWDIAVCIDADVLIDAHQVRAAVRLAAVNGGPVLAYDERMHLSRVATRRILGGYRGDWMRPKGFVRAVLHDSCSSAIVVSRNLWDAVGGFDETFIGWGWEDVAFRCAAETISGQELVKIGGKLWHLWHEVSSENHSAQPTFQANRARGADYVQARYDPARMAALLDEAHETRAAYHAPEGSARLPPMVAVEGIPRILHRTVPEDTSPEVDQWWAHACALHPGWEYRTWRDPLDPAEWPRTGHLWEQCTSGAQRAGLIRLEALQRFGGVYLDSDVELYRPLDALLGAPAFAGWEDPRVVPDAVLGSVADHPILDLMLEEACRAVELGLGAWESGPGVTTALLPNRRDVLLLPPGSFYPYHYSEKNRRRNTDHRTEQPWAFGAHHWHASWVK